MRICSKKDTATTPGSANTELQWIVFSKHDPGQGLIFNADCCPRSFAQNQDWFMKTLNFQWTEKLNETSKETTPPKTNIAMEYSHFQ